MATYSTTNSDIRRWLGGIPYEVAFWRSYYGNAKRRRDLFRWSCYDKPFNLEDFDIHSFVSTIDNPVILDVGSSLSYMMGNIIAGLKRDIHFVDPLAPFYNRILDRYNIDRPRIDFGMIECLSMSFGRETVDFVHVRNALDHCANPAEGIIQCLEILRPGGVLYLNHHPDEAEREGYRGFHQFNVIDSDGCLVIWNRETRLNVNEMLRGVADVRVSRSAAGNVVAVITKTASPDNLYSREATARRMADILTAVMTYFHSLPDASSYQFKRLYTSAAHRLMRLLPFGTVRKIKALLTRKK